MEHEERNMYEPTLSAEEFANAHKSLESLISEAFENSGDHGFHSDLQELSREDNCDIAYRNFILADLAKITSEIGEAVSAIQHNDYEHCVEELADIVIRTFDLGGIMKHYGKLEDEIVKKMIYNRSRPYKHGKTC